MLRESAKELVEKAIQQTVDFEAQAELKATFASMAYEKENPVRFHSRSPRPRVPARGRPGHTHQLLL